MQSATSGLPLSVFDLRHRRLRKRDTKKETRARVSLFLEAPPGFEPGRQSFADSCLTTWLCRRILSNVTQQALFYHNKIQLSILNLQFKKKIERESRRYWYEDSLEYDPLSVCFSVRIRIEENVYNQLQKDEHKREFIATHSTKEKLHYAKSLGITIPETYFLLGIVYNHPLHSIDNNTAKSLALKLDNAIIKQMIKNLWSSNQIIATP